MRSNASAVPEVAHHRAQARGSEHGLHFGETRGLDLQHGTEFFREEFGDGRVVISGRQRDVEPAVTGEGHLGQRREQAAVRTIVVREDQPLAPQFDDRADERTQAAGVVAVRRVVADAAIDLRQAGRAEAIAAGTQVDEQQARGAAVEPQLRRERAAHVLDRRERRDDQRHRRNDLARAIGRIPRGLHRQRVLADRNRDAERGAEFFAHRVHGVVEVRVLARLAAGGHPVRGQPDVFDAANVGGDDVGDGLGDGHAARCGGVEQRERRALTHRHRLAVRREIVSDRDRDVAHRDLPRTDQRIATDHAADRAVADRDQERLVRDGRQAQHAQRGFTHVCHVLRREAVAGVRHAPSRRASFSAACRAASRAACRPARCRTADRPRAAPHRR